jgi:hypothetical protein
MTNVAPVIPVKNLDTARPVPEWTKAVRPHAKAPKMRSDDAGLLAPKRSQREPGATIRATKLPAVDVMEDVNKVSWDIPTLSAMAVCNGDTTATHIMAPKKNVAMEA